MYGPLAEEGTSKPRRESGSGSQLRGAPEKLPEPLPLSGLQAWKAQAQLCQLRQKKKEDEGPCRAKGRKEGFDMLGRD